MKKSGISTIIASVLIVLITVAGISLLWFGVYPLIDVKISSYEASVSLVTDKGYTFYDENNDIASIQIEVKGKDQPKKIQVLFTMSDGSVFKSLVDAPLINSRKKYTYNFSEYVGVYPIGISLAPVFGDVDSENLETKTSEIKMPKRIEESSYYDNINFTNPDNGCFDISDCGSLENCIDGSCTSACGAFSYEIPSSVTCNVVTDPYFCNNSIDDDILSFWYYALNNASNAVFDLDEIKCIKSINLTRYNSGDNITIYISDDNSNWDYLDTVLSASSWPDNIVIELSQIVDGRYLKISKETTSSVMFIFEVEIETATKS